MNRIELINYFIEQRNAMRYLEIGVHDEKNTFEYVQCAYKVTTFPSPSKEFFSNNLEEFDIIFIDGIHTEEQVLQDINYACRSLAKAGVIVLHDCMPPDEWHQRESDTYKAGENWNGTVWRAVLRFFNETNYKCTLLDTDWGCGVIDTAQSQHPKYIQLSEKLGYGEHYPYLLEYKKSIASYLRDQVKVFYHLACLGNWQEVLKEQMLQLKLNGFQQINMTVLGTGEELITVNEICNELEVRVQIICHSPEVTQFEKPTLLAIEDYAKENKGYVLYLHSKGVSSPCDDTKEKWRRLMMKELVDNWDYCVSHLPVYDIIGVNWRDMPPISHFSGNFWYASTRYLRSLLDFNEYYEKHLYQPSDHKRLCCEFWISSGSEMPRLLSIFCRNIDFCDHNFWNDM